MCYSARVVCMADNAAWHSMQPNCMSGLKIVKVSTAKVQLQQQAYHRMPVLSQTFGRSMQREGAHAAAQPAGGDVAAPPLAPADGRAAALHAGPAPARCPAAGMQNFLSEESFCALTSTCREHSNAFELMPPSLHAGPAPARRPAAGLSACLSRIL